MTSMHSRLAGTTAARMEIPPHFRLMAATDAIQDVDHLSALHHLNGRAVGHSGLLQPVRFVVVGEVAATIYGLGNFPARMALVLDRDADNRKQFEAVLKALESDGLHPNIDVLQPLSKRFSYRALLRSAEMVDLGAAGDVALPTYEKLVEFNDFEISAARLKGDRETAEALIAFGEDLRAMQSVIEPSPERSAGRDFSL